MTETEQNETEKTILHFLSSKVKETLFSNADGSFSGPCPICQDGVDRFTVWPDSETRYSGAPVRGAYLGRWYCRQCKDSGDSLALLVAMGMDYQEAREKVGHDGTSGQAETFSPKHPGGKPGWQAKPEREPDAAWREYMSAWVESNKINLYLPECQNELTKRHLTIEEAKYLGLAWNPSSSYEAPEKCGEKGGLMLFPAGLIIPIKRKSGIVGVRVRRRREDVLADQLRLDAEAAEEGREKPKRADKYRYIRGSGSGHCVLGVNPRLVVVCEAEIDAMRYNYLLDGKITSLAIPAAGKPTLPEHELLSRAKKIFIALDGDGPGQSAVKFFLDQYRQAVHVPLPEGKGLGDLPDYDLLEWTLKALS